MNLRLKPQALRYRPAGERRLVRRIRMPLALLTLAVALVATLLVNTLRFSSRQLAVEPAAPLELDKDSLATHLSEAVRFQTISFSDGTPADEAAFDGLRAYLEQTFPRVHAALSREVVGGHSLLYTWHGRDQSRKPILLIAHLDVVPVEASSEAQWTYPPFGGQIADGYIWGRGTLDDKSSVLGILEAVELLLSHNVEPERSVYLAFGHDEEIGGRDGAVQMARLLRERNLAFEYIVDEGSFITDGVLPGIEQPVAMVGVAEKGILNLELSISGESGHSSVPPAHTAIGELSAALTRLEASPMPGGIDGVVGDMFATLGPEMPFVQRLVFANLWLFGPLVERQLAAAPTSNALMRTTTAVTMISGGVKENVLPLQARAVVNFRILPGNTREQIVEHVRAAVANPRVAITSYGESDSDPSAVSATDAAGFAALERTIRQVYPDVLVAPSQVLGGTDSRHYTGLSEQVYRFRPQRYRPDDIERFHGIDERIAVDDYAQGVRFFYRLLSTAVRE